MRGLYCPLFGKFSLAKTCIVFVFSAIAIIASPAQTLTTLASFNGANGANPYAGLVQATDGNFYGTTVFGGMNGFGDIFKITPTGTLSTLYSFCAQSNCTDGVSPYAGLVPATDGNFYGTTDQGGDNGFHGTVFKITPTGVLTTLYRFCAQSGCTDGAYPYAGLVQATDGNFYGTTLAWGADDAGTVFKITPAGTLSTLYSFCAQSNCTDGVSPYAELVQATDGNFYGTTSRGGANGSYGTVFKITPAGTLTTLHSFDNTDGAYPEAVLLQAADGNFYGTTYAGGASDKGTLFKITPAGTLTTLHSFNTSDGANPYAGLIQATDGNFYGTTFAGGASDKGTLFKITPAGTLTTLYSFCAQSNCADGANPYAGLIQATDGNFYGTTYAGGASNAGTVFRLSSNAVQFVAATPCRVVDTRNLDGTFGGPAIQGNTFRSFPIPQNTNCNIPSSAAAYSLNVTVVPHGPLNYLTIWPTGQQQPFVSTMNSPDGRIKANAAIVPAGDQGAVSVYVTDTSDVVLDIDGYFGPSAQNTYQFYPLTPCRVVDTRPSGSNLPPGLGPPSFGEMEQRELPILSHSPCFQGLSNQPKAYSFNVTVVPNPQHHPLNYLTIWPSDQDQPFVSTLNNPTATVVANAAIVPAAANGDVSVFTFNSTDVVIDTNGYFAAPGQNGYSFYPLAPCRAYDSRTSGDGQPFMGDRTVSIVGSMCAPPSTATGYIFNATVVPSGFLDYLTLWPHGEMQPVVSTLNAYDAQITSNMAIVPNLDGSLNAYASQLTHLILDISGYFAP